MGEYQAVLDAKERAKAEFASLRQRMIQRALTAARNRADAQELTHDR